MTKGSTAGRVVGGLAVAMAAAAAWWSFQEAQARAHWQAAERAVADQDAERACDQLAACLERWGGRAEVRLAAARAARLAGRYEEAEGRLAWCEQTAPGAEVGRERALFQVEQGDLAGQLAVLAPRGPADPAIPPDVLDAAAHGFAATFFVPEALQCLGRLFAYDAEHVRGHLLAGEVFARQGHFDLAAEHFARVVRRLPEALAPRRRLAECLLEAGELRQAGVHLDVLRQRHPDDAGVLLAQARLHVYRGQPDQAKDGLEALLAREPDHVGALVELGRLQLHHGDPDGAADPLRRAVAADPEEAAAWEVLAHVYDALGQSAEAGRCREELARVRRARGEATRLELRITQEQPKDVGLRFDLANRYERLHEADNALAWRFATLQLDPGHRPTHQALAAWFERTGQPHRAARHRRLAGE